MLVRVNYKLFQKIFKFLVYVNHKRLYFKKQHFFEKNAIFQKSLVFQNTSACGLDKPKILKIFENACNSLLPEFFISRGDKYS